MLQLRFSGWTPRIRRAGSVAVLSAAALGVWASPASADLVDPPGSCVGTGTWRDGGFTVDSTTAGRAEVIEVPRADEVAWTGALVDLEPGGERQIAGSVVLALPVPLGALTINDWSGPATSTSTSGIQSYDLPALVPAGVVFGLRAEHYENGELFCSGNVRLRIAGSPMGSPLTWVALGLTLLLGVLLAVTGLGASPGVGRLVVGGLLGLLLGWSTGLSLIALGLSPLDSPVPVIAAVLGFAGGAVWGRLSPLRRLRPSAKTPAGSAVGIGQ